MQGLNAGGGQDHWGHLGGSLPQKAAVPPSLSLALPWHLALDCALTVCVGY